MNKLNKLRNYPGLQGHKGGGLGAGGELVADGSALSQRLERRPYTRQDLCQSSCDADWSAAGLWLHNLQSRTH